MSIPEMERKLANAVRDFKGRKLSNGKWFRPPNPNALSRVQRWIFRLRQAGVEIDDEVENRLVAPLAS